MSIRIMGHFIKQIWKLCGVLAVCAGVVLGVSMIGTVSARAAAAVPDAGNDRRVYDMAGLLTPEEIQGFENTILEYRSSMKLDMVVVTTNDSEGKTAREYADDFYDQGGFGYGKKKNGVLFLIAMDTRELYVSTGGDVIRLLTDKRIDKILDDTYNYAGTGDYAGCVEAFLKDFHGAYKKGIESGQYTYDTETGAISVHRSIRWYEALLALAVSAFVAAGACKGVVYQYGMKKEHDHAAGYLMAYRADSKFLYQDEADQLLNKSVSTMILPRSSNRYGGGGFGGGGSASGRSSTHTSSGGSTHGGGGRRF